jgi:YhcH/YjgK/YiaL family protein
MILDHIDNALLYGSLGRKIAIGLALLNEESVLEAEPGRYAVEGDDLFYIVEEYATQPVETGRLEIHRRHLDIQFIAAGRECIGTAPLEGLSVETPYNGEKDIAFYHNTPTVSRLILTPGMFAIFWPSEPHMPQRSAETSERVKKIVVKIPME